MPPASSGSRRRSGARGLRPSLRALMAFCRPEAGEGGESRCRISAHPCVKGERLKRHEPEEVKARQDGKSTVCGRAQEVGICRCVDGIEGPRLSADKTVREGGARMACHTERRGVHKTVGSMDVIPCSDACAHRGAAVAGKSLGHTGSRVPDRDVRSAERRQGRNDGTGDAPCPGHRDTPRRAVEDMCPGLEETSEVGVLGQRVRV